MFAGFDGCAFNAPFFLSASEAFRSSHRTLEFPMGVAERLSLQPLEIGQGLDADHWAAQEFAGAKLGDSRLADRLVSSAQALGAMPGRTLSGARQGDWPAVKGYYRMIDKPDESALNAQAILAPHRARTVQRMMWQPTVLCIQDGTDLNYKHLDQCIDLGVLSKNQTGTKTRGLHLHSTFVVSTEGLPLGVLEAQFSAPQPKSETDSRPAASIAIEEKKTFAWIKGLRDCVELDKQLPDTQQICVMDREADFFELFDEQRKTAKVDLLVRSRHDRTIDDEGGQRYQNFSLYCYFGLRTGAIQTDVELFSAHIPSQ